MLCFDNFIVYFASITSRHSMILQRKNKVRPDKWVRFVGAQWVTLLLGRSRGTFCLSLVHAPSSGCCL